MRVIVIRTTPFDDSDQAAGSLCACSSACILEQRSAGAMPAGRATASVTDAGMYDAVLNSFVAGASSSHIDALGK